MKTYCKPATVNIEDWKFNEIAVVECFRNKRSRKDFQRLLCKTGKITKREIVEDQLNKDFKRTLEAESEVAKMLTQRIINRDLQLKPIRQFQRIDGLTQKLRDICQESPEQQVFEYIGVYALKPLFRAKILPIQYGSIPNKGGVAGKRKIERLLRKKFHGKVVALKGDVTKAYPSVTVPIVMEMLRRDIGKNKVLLWFLGALMSNYPGNHLCIGGYLPAWLFNYVMSYVLRYIYEQAQIRRGKRNRLIYAIVCYADDFTIYGDVSKLKKAMKKATIWAHDKFGLKIKDIWQFYQVASFDEERENLEERRKGSKKRTPGVDMMGYVVRRKYTTIRGRVFRRIRRQVLRAWEDFKAKGFIPWWRACRIAAYKGWIKHSNSLKFRMKYCFDKLFKMCSYSASKHGKEVENEKRILLIAALSS
ncbi:Reverse transcriptase (RNA-dependent DNA polymerase) [Eubacterium ramulus]|uniref:Reverse transcriptase (RNA-dependent DNA polymerase) n=1 Tax=Eubacterium ramulus TaxID=39490 RepID=UPI0035A320D2